MAQEPTTETPAPSLTELASNIVAEQLSPVNLDKLRKHAQNTALEQRKDDDEYRWQTSKWMFEEVTKRIIEATDFSEDLLNPLAKGAIESLLSAGESTRRVGSNSGDLLLQKIAGSATSVEPGTEGAARYLTIFLNESVEAWLRGVAVEVVTEFMPKIAGIGGGVETVQRLQEIIESALGGSRMIRRVLQPFISATAITPAQWHVNKKYAPELLSASALAHGIARGQFTAEEAVEELARQGYSSRRAAALISDALATPSTSMVLDALWVKAIDEVEARLLFGYVNYDATMSNRIVQWDRLNRIDTIHRQAATAAVTAFVAREIDEPDMNAVLDATIVNIDERTAMSMVARARRSLNTKRLTIGELRALVKDGIATVADFRRRLEYYGYPIEDVTMLELQLRHELDEKKSIEQHKRELDAERALEKEAAAQAKTARDAEIAAKKARAEFPPLADYRRGYVHGLIDRDVLADALTRDGIVQDQALYLGDADEDRGAYLAAQEKRAKAEAVAAAGGLSIAQLEQAVLDGVLTLPEFDAQLARRDTPDDDRRVLTAMLQVRLDNRAKAEEQRKAAEQRAQLRGVSNTDWQRAVRLGVRTIDQYGDFLKSIDTPDLARALMLDLLRKEVADDQAAAAKRDARDADAAKRGIALSERRRTVIAGVRPIEWYASVLPSLNWPVDDQLADLDLLRVEVANADAVRTKRAALAQREAIEARDDAGITTTPTTPTTKARPAPSLTLAQLESAFKLGLITADEFADALVARNYAAGDAEMIVQLAVLSLPNVRAGAAEREKVVAAQTPRDAPISDLEHAIRRGSRPFADYASEIVRRGFSEDAAELMAENLAEQLAIDVDSLRSKIATAMAKGSADYTLDELTAAFNAGELDAAQLRDAIVNAGAPTDAALVYSRLVGTIENVG